MIKPAPGMLRPTSSLHPPFVHLVVSTVVPLCVGSPTRLRTAVEGHYSSAPGGGSKTEVPGLARHVRFTLGSKTSSARPGMSVWQNDLFQETLHCCPRSVVRLLVVERARQERPIRCRIGEGIVGVAVGDNLPIANIGSAHLIFKGSNVVGRRQRIVRPGQDEYTSPDLAGQGRRFGCKHTVKAHDSFEVCSIAC